MHDFFVIGTYMCTSYWIEEGYFNVYMCINYMRTSSASIMQSSEHIQNKHNT